MLASAGTGALADDDPAAAVVHCGQVLTSSTVVSNDLAECPGDGLVVGAPGISINLNGHTIDGVGLGAGIRNDGFASATIRNGTVRDFDYGVKLELGTEENVIESLTLELDQLAGIEVSAGDPGLDPPESEPTGTPPGGRHRIRANTIRDNGYGIALLGASQGNSVLDNSLAGNSKEHLMVDHSSHNRIDGNSVYGGGDGAFVFLYSDGNHLGSNTIHGASDQSFLLQSSNANTVIDNHVELSGDAGILLKGSSENTFLANHVESSSDAPYALIEQSAGNQLAGNSANGGGDAGILVKDSDGNRLIANLAHHSADAGIALDTANHTLVRGNDVRSNVSGIQLQASNDNLVEGNSVIDQGADGVEVDGESAGNQVLRNVARRTGGEGISVASGTLVEEVPLDGNVLAGNTATANQSGGIYVAKAGHTISGNFARDNDGWGIYAAEGGADSGGNLAGGNAEPLQCYRILCGPLSELPDDGSAPQTTIDSGPANPTRSAAAVFTFSSSEPHSTFECALDGGAFEACDSPFGYTGLSAGGHRFAVRATDLHGNPDPTPAERSWTIDPSAQPTLPPGVDYPRPAPPVPPPDSSPSGAVPGEGAATATYFAAGATPPRRACRGLSGRRLARCRINLRIARKCGRLRGRRKRICAKRVRAVARCRRMSGHTRRARLRKAACIRRAKAIGRRR